MDGGVNDATQYDGILPASKVATTKYGIVSQSIQDDGGNETQILKWMVKNNQAYQVFKNKESMKAIVRYTKVIDAAKGINQYVYVTLNWTPSKRNVTPAGTLADADKNRAYWYAKMIRKLELAIVIFMLMLKPWDRKVQTMNSNLIS